MLLKSVSVIEPGFRSLLARWLVSVMTSRAQARALKGRPYRLLICYDTPRMTRALKGRLDRYNLDRI